MCVCILMHLIILDMQNGLRLTTRKYSRMNRLSHENTFRAHCVAAIYARPIRYLMINLIRQCTFYHKQRLQLSV